MVNSIGYSPLEEASDWRTQHWGKEKTVYGKLANPRRGRLLPTKTILPGDRLI
jgi:hypothetical protein